ncbi:MAG: hypothetical protein KAI07_03805, partial [Deltaproteobacteria bacterium]|nr:hypothetical protein [Deltaproteobacteria bacterium]
LVCPYALYLFPGVSDIFDDLFSDEPGKTLDEYLKTVNCFFNLRGSNLRKTYLYSVSEHKGLAIYLVL